MFENLAFSPLPEPKELPDQPADVESLQRILLTEIFKALGLLRSNDFRDNPAILRWLCHKLEWLFDLPTLRFAELGATFDQAVARCGFMEAARSVLPRFVRGVQVLGKEAIPDSGPLLIASNHPGAYDSLALAAQVPHPRLKVVVGDIPFLSYLPWARRHLIFVFHDPHQRMTVIRQAVRHLQSGGALLIFPSGTIDPDPAVLPGEMPGFQRWSASLEVFLRCVPQTQVVLAAVSGVLSASWVHHPVTFLRRGLVDRLRLAEFFQVIQQMLQPGGLLLEPRLTFLPPFRFAEEKERMNKLIDRARSLLQDHMSQTDQVSIEMELTKS